MKVKVIEVTGQKLDPKAKYLLAFDETIIPRADIRLACNRLRELVGDNFTALGVRGDPHGAVAVFEVVPKKGKK